MKSIEIGIGATEDLMSALRVFREGKFVFFEIISFAKLPFWDRVNYAFRLLFLNAQYVYSIFELNQSHIKGLKRVLDEVWDDWKDGKE